MYFDTKMGDSSAATSFGVSLYVFTSVAQEIVQSDYEQSSMKKYDPYCSDSPVHLRDADLVQYFLLILSDLSGDLATKTVVFIMLR